MKTLTIIYLIMAFLLGSMVYKEGKKAINYHKQQFENVLNFNK